MKNSKDWLVTIILISEFLIGLGVPYLFWLRTLFGER